jgi:hypothetical protein
MAVVEGQFQELEKRFAAFKYVFGRLQTSYDIAANFEPFPTSPQVYLDSLINGQINFANADGDKDSVVLPARTRTWQIGTHTGTQVDTDDPSSDNLWAGNFITTTPNPAEPGGYDPETNPNVEKVIIPLVKMADTNNQAYFAYEFQGDEIDDGVITNDFSVDTSLSGFNDTHIAYGSAFSRAEFANSPYKDRRLKRFIDPIRFGKSYTAEVRASDDDRTTFDGGGGALVNPSAFSSNAVKQRGGWIFDYNEGMLYMAPHKNSDFPYMAGFKHPLWLIAYRYIGPTGSNMSVTSAGSAGSAVSAGSGGGGVSTTLTSLPSNMPGAYDTNEFGWYDTHTFSATDSEDIIEYISDGTIVVSSSFGPRDLVVRLDSSSYNNITADEWPTYETTNETARYNDANLFKFTTETKPDFSSYGLFQKTVYANAPHSSSWVTQSFYFNSPIRLDRIGLCFSNNNNIEHDDIAYEQPASTAVPAAFKLEGSTDAIRYTLIASASGLVDKLVNGVIQGPILDDISVEEQEGGVHFGPGLNSTYWPNDDDVIMPTDVNIFCATASIATASRYRYYKLYVSGGQVTPELEDDDIVSHNVMALHHVDLWQNLDFGPTNRKQLNVKVNNTLSNKTGLKGDPLTQFDLAISASAAKLGLVSMSAADLTVFQGGLITETIKGSPPPDVGGIDLQNFRDVTASKILVNNSIITTGEISASAFKGSGNNLSFNAISVAGDAIVEGELSVGNFSIQNELNIASDIKLSSGKSISFTNRTQDGNPGTDEFSARIFGNYNIEGGVSDMYLDAYRIYNVADAKVDIRTLHPTRGRIVLQSPVTFIDGALHTSQSIIAGSITASNGMLVSGSILISGSIIPSTDASKTSSFDLGSPNAAWHDLHISDGTIRFYDGTSERANISLGTNNEIQFKTGTEFQDIRAGELNIGPTLGSSVQISDNGRGFIAVSKNGSHATILRAEDQALGVLGADMVHGSLTQKGSGSFAIILDANNQNQARSKFSVISNSEAFSAAQLLFQVSESGETRAYGHIKADNYITATNITASNTISANSFVGTFVGALSSSAQIARSITGSFTKFSSSFDNRLTVVETELSNTLISGSSQIASEISGAFQLVSGELDARMATIELELGSGIISSSVQIATEISGAFTIVSESLSNRISLIDLNQNIFTTTSSFNALSASVQTKANASVVQSIIDSTGSFAVNNSNATFTVVTASNLHTTTFNPAIIDTTILSSSLSNLGTITNARTFTIDDFNTLFATSSRPVLTVRNEGGNDITYFGTPVDNADAFIKFEADRSNSHYVVGIDSNFGDFIITSGSTLLENGAGSYGQPTFRIQNNKVGIGKDTTISYTLDVAGDIRSTGTLRVNTITNDATDSLSIMSDVTASANISASGIISATSFVGDGTALTGIATLGNVVANSATASFLTNLSVIDGGSF